MRLVVQQKCHVCAFASTTGMTGRIFQLWNCSIYLQTKLHFIAARLWYSQPMTTDIGSSAPPVSSRIMVRYPGDEISKYHACWLPCLRQSTKLILNMRIMGFISRWVYGGSMVGPWWIHGGPMSPWRHPTVRVNQTFLYPWYLLGGYMVGSWCIRGGPMVDPWSVRVASAVHPHA